VWRRGRYQPFADPGFQQKIALKFHDHFWEMYLACALMDHGYQLAPKGSEAGPDMCILHSGQRIWVEAVAPSPGKGADAVPLPQLGRAEYVPEGKIILRLRSAIEQKWQQYLSHVANGHISSADPYIIAINGGYIPHASAVGSGLPYIVQAVSRLGPRYVSLDRETLEIRGQGYSHLPFVQKVKGTQIPTGIFVDGGYDGVSGVLYSGAWILNLPARHGSEFVFVHNAQAVNPMSRDWVSGTEFWSEETAWYKAYRPTRKKTRVADA
jgi:type I restriction enzyme S subunit